MKYFNESVQAHTPVNVDLINNMYDFKIEAKNMFFNHRDATAVLTTFMYKVNNAPIPNRDIYFESLIVNELFRYSDRVIKEILKRKYNYLELNNKDELKAYLKDGLKDGVCCDYELYEVLENMEGFLDRYPEFKEELNDILLMYVIRCVDIAICRVKKRIEQEKYNEHKREYEYYQKQL